MKTKKGIYVYKANTGATAYYVYSDDTVIEYWNERTNIHKATISLKKTLEKSSTFILPEEFI